MKIYLNAQYKCVKVEDNTFVANSTSNFIRYYFVQNADGTLADEITESTEVYLNQEPSYVTLGFRRADGNTIQHLMATPKTEGTEAFWEYVITETDGVLYKKGALEVSAQFINATLNGENKIISQKVMAVAINTAHILDNIGEEAEEYYSQYEQANNEAHAKLQAQITEKFNNIGVMGSLTTDNKNTLVEAINEVDEHADKAQNDVNKLSDDIGDKLSLTTDEKNTIVGAINEVDEHADTAQTTADSASQTANNAKTVADTAKSIADSASQTANAAKTTANNASATANAIAGTANQAMTIAEQAKTIATNSVYSVSFEDIQSAVTALNGYDNAYFKVGNSIYLKQKDVPDMWVYAVASEYVEYTYTTDYDFVNALLLGTVQVGYYVLANLESTGDYDVLKNKPIINQDLSANGFTPVENTYYRHTGTTSETYTAGVVYFYNGTAYKAIDGAGGEVPTSLPATGAKITGNLPTNGWTPTVENFTNARILDEATYYDKEVIIYQSGYEQYIRLTGWEVNIDGEWHKLTKVGNVTYAYNDYNIAPLDGGAIIRWEPRSVNAWYYIHADGHVSAKSNLKSDVQMPAFRNTEISEQTFAISDTAIKTNSTVTMYLNSADEVRSYSKTDGSVVVEMDSVPTTAIPYTLQVVETSAEGAFEIINSYVPSIPETPTALPQTASALKSGNLPTSGWTDGDYVTYWTGDKEVYGLNLTLLFNNPNIYNDIANGTKIVGTTQQSSNINTSKLTNWGIKTIDNITGYVLTTYEYSYRSDDKKILVSADGNVYGTSYHSAGSSYYIHWTMIGKYEIKQKIYSISDTSITANSDILMELTDEGGVKSYSMEAGKITVIRDTVPTAAIPYTYKVKQTNASGQFTVINHYVPTVPNTFVESVNGQTGAVTIAVPTKTSDLTNDSGYVSNIPIVQNVVCNDVESATTLDTTITCEIGDLILAQIIVRSALTLPTGWTLLRTIPAVETQYNQTLSFAYKRATSTSETLTVTQATAGRIYTNLVRLSNATSISYIQSCEKTGTGIKSISSTKPVTPNMVIWGASSTLWQSNSPYGDWTYSPSTLDYYSLSQSTRAPRLGTFIDGSGAGERTFSAANSSGSGNAMMCGAVEIVGDEVARKGDIPSVTTLYEDSTGAATVTLSETINNGDIVRIKTNNGNVDNYYIGVAWNRAITVTESLMVTDESNVTVGTAINIYSLRFNIQDTSLILFHYFKTNITTAGAVTITNEKANVVIRKVERIHT